MTIYTYASLDKAVEKGETGTCVSVDADRIIIPTASTEIVGFTNPDDLSVQLLERWKNGERGPEFENQKLMPGDCLVMYDIGNDVNRVLAADPEWYKTADGIKKMVEKLYDCAGTGGKMTEPAIWNADLTWAKSRQLSTDDGREITVEVWQESSGRALNVNKVPTMHNFVHLAAGDILISPNGRVQTAGGMSAIAVKQPTGNWNMVQLNAKGYIVVNENIKTDKNKAKTDWLQVKQDALDKQLGNKVGETADRKSGKIEREHTEIAAKQLHITQKIMRSKRQKES